jgi:predicted phage tail component-like protein
MRTRTGARVSNNRKEFKNSTKFAKKEENMASIVKIPSTAGRDFDFLAFSFNGKHSWDDFKIYRTSDGSRYNEPLTPTLQDITAEVPGGDGVYFFGTTHRQKNFDINFAFERMTEAQFREMKKWLNGKELGDLWFEEAPYKVYTAKVTGSAVIKTLCFEEDNQRVYKGEGSVTFTAYWPYAHTPDYIKTPEGTLLNGNYHTSYQRFRNYQYIKEQLPNYTKDSCGDLPFHFIAYLDPVSGEGSTRNSVLTENQNGVGVEYSSNTNSGIDITNS